MITHFSRPRSQFCPQVLQEQDGWPVAKYVGACGRVVVEEYAGEMLTSYHHAPWLQRVHLSHQLLIAAHNFTDSHPLFGFYLTDISADNIAVDAQGKLKFVDLENVIVVDRNVPDEGVLMYVCFFNAVCMSLNSAADINLKHTVDQFLSNII
jgi:hypothetical protein